MSSRMSHIQVLRYAGLFTWSLVGFPVYLVSLPAEQGGVPGMDKLAWLGLGCWVLFGLCFWLASRALGQRRVTLADHAMLVVMSASAIGVSYAAANGLGSVLLMLAACVLPWIMSPARRPGLDADQPAGHGARLRQRSRAGLARSHHAVAALHRVCRVRVREQLRRPPAGAGPRRAATAEFRAARHPRPARRKRARQRAHPHLARAARPARPPPHRAEPEPRSRQPSGRRQSPGACVRRPIPWQNCC